MQRCCRLLRSFPWQQDVIGKIKPIFRDFQLQISRIGKVFIVVFQMGKKETRNLRTYGDTIMNGQTDSFWALSFIEPKGN